MGNTTSLPLVSVGIPTFNRASILVKAVESVLQQTYPNIQLVISDNASTDETHSICENFCKSDPRITYIRQKANLGAANNFTEVLRHSTGEYFMWLGDDDWIDDRYISECVKVLVDNPDYSLVCGKSNYYINQEFTGQGYIMNLEQDNGCDRVLSYYQQVSENGTFYGVMRRNQISNVPMKNTMGGDWLMIAVISFLGKVQTIPSIFVNRQVRENDSYEKLAKRLGVSEFQGRYPMFSIAISASKDIFVNDNYKPLNFLAKIYLSLNIISVFIKRYNQFIPSFVAVIPKPFYPYIRSVYRFLVKKPYIN
jgi:glycosyltransferase domain-containing protein